MKRKKSMLPNTVCVLILADSYFSRISNDSSVLIPEYANIFNNNEM